MRVLIADDDVFARRILASILEPNGYEVVEAEDGPAAWKLMQAEDAPRLLLLDWMMPGMDGLELCRKLRARVGAAPIYVLLVTSKKRSEDVLAALEAGADNFIAKPYRPAELIERVRAAERVLALNLPARDRLLAVLREAARGPGSEVVVRDGATFGCVYFHRGRVAWAHVSTEPGSAQKLYEQAGVAAADVRAELEECKRTGANLSDRLVERGLVDRGHLERMTRAWIARRIEVMLALPAAGVVHVPEGRPFAEGLTFALDEVLPPALRAPPDGAVRDLATEPSMVAVRSVDASRRIRGELTLDASLLEVMRIDGAVSVGLFDRVTGACVGAEGEPLSQAEVQLHLRLVNIAISADEEVEDLMLASSRIIRLSRVVRASPRCVLVALLLRERTNLARARQAIAGVTDRIRVELDQATLD